MEEKKVSNDRLKLSRFKLDSLLDITLSINANLPTEDLLSKYESILRNDLGIGKILIFKRSATWECLLNGGFPKNFETLDVKSRLLDFNEITYVSADMGFEGVDIIVPVYNNNEHLAFLFIGDIEEEGEGMSPVIKHLNFIQTISSIIIVAIENIRLHKESLRQEALKKELELAARMQKMLIPDSRSMPKNPEMIVSGFYYPHYEVGGDYYDCVKLSETKTGICIADVSGKGISAAILMSNFQASLRALLTEDIKLDSLIQKLNKIVVSNAEGEKFITFFIARYDHKNKVLEYINAAHNSPVLLDTATNKVYHLKSSCVGIGMLDEIPAVNVTDIPIKNFSKIVCYTDGLSELKGEDGADIGTKEIIRYISNKDPVEKNLQEMIRFLGIPDTNPYLFDDVSIIAADLR
ncbi:MAG: serine/threonine-protein phosphatase [Bacteroidales bacterium]|jgi:sigma-B regulation protein RsbU (phosphoserine phosphatase)|nr:serine/threonine-protein phosphatase [Bacteroidales bacterium]